MKKLRLFSLIILIPILASCGGNNSKSILTYGTYIDKTAIEINGSKLFSKLNKENFVLAIHPDEGSCGCWSTFSSVIDTVVELKNLTIYKTSFREINDELYKIGFQRFDDQPSFYIVANNKIVKSYYYSDNSVHNLFINENLLYEEVGNRINYPKMFIIDETMLNEKTHLQEATIYYYKDNCDDCSYYTPNELVPYLLNNNIKDNIYAINIENYNSDPEIYQTFKDNHYLSNKNNQDYGYNNGYVPTLQYYQNGNLKDMMVYFNETISDGVIVDSYYSEARQSKLNYLDGLTTKVLTGATVKSEDLNEAKNGFISKEKGASYYHDFSLAFLNKYLKK